MIRLGELAKSIFTEEEQVQLTEITDCRGFYKPLGETRMTRNLAISIAQEYIKLVKKTGIPVQTAKIFGSHIHGTARRGSDIDVAIISPAFGRDRQKERIRLMLLARGAYADIEPHPLSPADFVDRQNLLAFEIQKNGITL